MGNLISFPKSFRCHSEDQNPTYVPKNDDPVSQGLRISLPGSDLCQPVVSRCNYSIGTDNLLHYQSDSVFQDSLDNPYYPSSSDPLQLEVSISSAFDLSCKDSNSIESDNSVNDNDIESGLPEESHFQEMNENNEKAKWLNDYSSLQKILVVGEGDFSFSVALAMAFGSASNITATSPDSKGFLKNSYESAMSNIEALKKRGCKVHHGVDPEKIAIHPLLEDLKFDRIIFNFPFAGFFKNKSRESKLRRHQRLVSLFFGNAREMITETGEIHLTQLTNNIRCEWSLEDLANHQGLRLIEKVHFDYNDYPGYRTTRGFGGSHIFNSNPSKTFKFCKM